jgi:S-DNA-T family DNA segregation ATPase FtsK/SpoIIIE
MSDPDVEVDDVPGSVEPVPTQRAARHLRPGEIDPKKWHVTLADDEPVERVPVDPPDEGRTLYATVLEAKTSDRRPIVPAWLRNQDERVAVLRNVTGRTAHKTAYHVTRTPKYAAKLAVRSPVGAGRAVLHGWRWVFDREAHELRAHAVRAADAKEYRALSKQRNARVKLRGLVIVAVAVLLAAGAVAARALAPAWAQVLLILVAVAVLGWAGSPADRPLLDVAVITPRFRRLSAEIVMRAFVAAKLAKDPTDLSFPQPIYRDGPGWRATIDLPYGVTAGDVVEKRPALASGLDLALGQVWPEPVTGGSVRRVVLWVGDEDISQRKPVAWPLIKDGRVDLFQPFTFGRDNRGNPVPMLLMFTSMVIGAVPRMGKSFALRLLLLAAALDPSAELHVYDLKGGADYVPLTPVAHRIGIGDDPEIIEQGLTDLRGLQKEMRRRYGVLRELPADICPESKVTRQLADTKRLRLHPIVLGVDECQVWFTHPDDGKELEALVTDLVKRGPAVGIIVLLATQKPDTTSLPSGIRDNAGTKLAMRVTTWQVSEMITGSGMAKAGINAASLSRADRGVGYLVGASDDVDAQLVRSDLVDSNAAKVVVARAVALRDGTGGITGQAAGEAPEKPAGSTLLDDVLLVIKGDARIHSETVCERLAELRPEQYRRLDSTGLATALKALGVETRQLKIGDVNRRGIDRERLIEAIAERDGQLALGG